MFSKKFKLEDMIEFGSEKLRLEYYIKLYNFISYKLYEIRMMEMIHDQ